MFYYAQLDINDNVAVKSQQPTQINAENMIEISSLDDVECGQHYNRESEIFES